MRKGMDISIRLVIVMVVLVIVAALLGLISNDYFGVFQAFGQNQSQSANFSVF